jgi:hypothetical protein
MPACLHDRFRICHTYTYTYAYISRTSSVLGLNGLEPNAVILVKWPAKLFPLRELQSSNFGLKTRYPEVLHGLPLK